MPASVQTPPRGGLSLERKLPLWMSLLLAAVVGALAWASYTEVRTASITAAEERLKRFTTQLADLSVASSDQRAALMRAVAADPRVAAYLTVPRELSIDSSLIQRLMGPIDSTLAVEIRDRSGRLRASTARLLPDDERRALAIAKEVIATDSVRNSAIYARGDSVFFWTAGPIPIARRTAGVLLQRRLITNSPRAERQIVNLLGTRDAMVYVGNASNDLWVTLVGKRAPVPPSASQDSIFSYQRDRTPMLASRIPVRGTPWIVVSEMPQALVMQRSHDFLRRIALVALLVVIAGTAVAWLLSRHITQPLVTLRAAAESVASGAESTTVSVSSRDEVGVLAASFNAMAERVRESATQSARLQAVTAALSSARTPEEVATVIVEQGIAAVDARAGSICLLSADGTALEIIRAQGYSPAVLADWMHFPLSLNVPLTKVVRTGEPEFISSVDEYMARFPEHRPSTTPPSNRAWAALPLTAEGRVFGALGLSFGTEGPFTTEAQAFMRTLAQQCAQALDRSRLYQAERAARREAEEARARADDARRTAESANQAKSDFLATMSHELRTPLNAIGGYTELMEMGLRGPVTDEQRQDLQRIRKSQTHLLNLINDVLHFVKLDAGHVEYDLEDVKLDELIDELEPFIAPQIGAKGLRYNHRRCDIELAARADREKARQILLNLLSNAVKFTPSGGEIAVGCEVHEGSVAIYVRDTGVGVPAERLETIFDPFFQVDRRLTRSHDGIGLGLAISRDLARGMRGELSVSSTPERGSTFTLVLPRARVSEPTVSA